MTDRDIIETEPLSINPIIKRSLFKGTAMSNDKGRIYTDHEVAHLPSINNDHSYHNEWKSREHSTKRLLKQVQQAGSWVNILEVGCGNGWLAARLASITSGEVIGIDINVRELWQAQRVFTQLTNLDFVAADISDRFMPDKQFDIIVFAASIEYFSSLRTVITTAMKHLTLMGQIHILDSPIRASKDTFAKKQEATDLYIHHMGDLEAFQHKIIYDPGAWINKLFAKWDPFFHIIIKDHYH